ncbi:MAG: hypothetical protein ACYC8T_14740 [Myxococcaceae bacterium]
MRLDRHLLVALAGAFALCACPREPAPDDERLLQKLKAEQQRLAGGAPAAQAPAPPLTGADDAKEKLAQLAAAGAVDEGARRLPPGNATVHVGSVAMKLASLSAGHSVSGGGKVSVTTPDLFLKVSLAAQNVGPAPAKLDLSFARVSSGGQDYPLARDAQRAAGTHELQREFPLSERADLVLYFELPKEALREGLKLVLPAAVGGDADVEVPLQ